MAVHIGDITLLGIQDLYIEEARNIAEHSLSDQQGVSYQDLGRGPTSIFIEGLLFGEEATGQMEALRLMHDEAEAVLFSADIAIGSDITDVCLQECQIRQIAGYENRYRFSLELKEIIEKPQSTAQSQANVQNDVEKDAANFEKDSQAATAALDNPKEISKTLEENPNTLAYMDADELADSLDTNIDTIDGKDFADSIKSVAELDPDKANSMLNGLEKKNFFEKFSEKFYAAKEYIQKALAVVDLAKTAMSLYKLATGFKEFAKESRGLITSAEDVIEIIRKTLNKKLIAPLAKHLRCIINSINFFFRDAKKLLEGDFIAEAVKLIKELKRKEELNRFLSEIQSLIKKIVKLAKDMLSYYFLIDACEALGDVAVEFFVRVFETKLEPPSDLGTELQFAPPLQPVAAAKTFWSKLKSEKEEIEKYLPSEQQFLSLHTNISQIDLALEKLINPNAGK